MFRRAVECYEEVLFHDSAGSPQDIRGTA
jgi:hypothetical protein